MKKNIVIKARYRIICCLLLLFIIFSPINFVYADTDDRDQSIGGIIQDGSSFIEMRRRTRLTDSAKWYSNINEECI